MTSQIATVNCYGTAGNPQPALLLDGKIIDPLGTPPAQAFVSAGADDAILCADLVKQIGDRVFWWQPEVVSGKILQYNKALNTWSVVFTMGAIAVGNADLVQGLHCWEDLTTGAFGLIGEYRSGASGDRILKYDYDTDTWTDNVATGILLGTAARTAIMFRGDLVVYSIGGNVTFINPVTLAFTNVLVGAIRRNGQLFTANGSLFLAAFGDGDTGVWQFQGAFWVKVASLPLPNTSVIYRDGAGVVIVDGNSAYMLYLKAGNTSWTAQELNLLTFTWTDREADVPALITGANATGTIEEEWKVGIFQDQEDPIGTRKYKLLWCWGVDGTAAQLYEYVAPGTPWLDLGQSEFTSFYSLPRNDVNGGSGRIFKVGESWGRIRRQFAAAGGITLEIRMYGNGDQSVEILGDGAGVVFDLGAGPALTKTPIEPGTVVIDYTNTISGAQQITDDGVGGLIGDVSGGATIDYDTGAMVGTTSVAVEAIPNAITVASYRTLKTISFRHDSNEETPQTPTTIVDPGLAGPIGGAAVLVGNTLTKVKVDNGVTDYLVKHDMIADGLASGARLHYGMDIVGP